MRFLQIFIFLTFISVSSAFACGGCVDSATASAGAKTIKSTYDTGDKALAKALDELIKSVNKVMIQEVSNNKKYSESSQFNLDSLTFIKQLSFLHFEKSDLLKKEIK